MKSQVAGALLFAIVCITAGCGGGTSMPTDGASNAWRQFRAASGSVVYCMPGTSAATACHLGPSFPCSGNPEIRVCEIDTRHTHADCAAGRLRIIGEFRNELYGHCPSGTFICPPTGQYVMMIRSITPGEAFNCPNES